MLPTTFTSQLKEKVRVLEVSTIECIYIVKVSEQAAELNHLRRLTSSEVSSASEATPETFLPRILLLQEIYTLV